MAYPALVHQTQTQFVKSVVPLCPNTWTVVGFAASTQHMIKGDKTVTIVDTSESTEAAENGLAEFRKITDRPVARIIYTHSHRHHIPGATGFSEGRDIPIPASAGFSSNLIGQDESRIAPNMALGRRTRAQFGFDLTPDQRISLGGRSGDRPLNGIGAGHIAPTQPVFGADMVREVLTTTRATILHVMQHTADGMHAGLPMDDIAATITLLAEIADRPWLGEFYGKASWSAGAYATGTLGWYNGNPTHLGTLSSVARATRMAQLAGGVDALTQAAETTDDLQWRLELCVHLVALGVSAQELKAATMETLAQAESNATAHNTYIWKAKRLWAMAASAQTNPHRKPAPGR